MTPRSEIHGQECDELPLDDGRFEITVTPRSRSADDDMSARAQDAALHFDKLGGETKCVLRFRTSRPGIPFFTSMRTVTVRWTLFWSLRFGMANPLTSLIGRMRET